MGIFGDFDSKSLSFENCIFENIFVDVMFGDLKVNNCLLISSIVCLEYGSGYVNNSNFTKDSQGTFGKDISVTVSNSNFLGGTHHAIFAYNVVNIENCTFRDYSCDYGAAIHNEGGIGYVKNCLFINNSAPKYGGAIYNDPWGSNILIENCSFINNSAKYGSAIAWNSSDNAVIRNCIFDNNKVLGSNSIASTLYFINDYNNDKNMSKLNITANNNFWGSNNTALSDIFKSKNGESFKLSSVLSLRIKSNGKDSYTVYFADKSGSKVSKMPDYRVSLKDRKTGAVIAKDLLMVNGQASFKYNKTLAEDGFMILNQGGGSALKLTTKVTPTKLVCYYLSGRAFNVKVVDKYTKKALSGIKLKLKVYTGKKHKMYYVTTNSKGIAKFKCSSLSAGTHKVIVSASDKKYSLGQTASSIKINKAKTVLSAPKISAKYKRSSYFKIKVKHMSTKKYIKGLKLKLRVCTGKKYKTYTVKTNSKGIAKFNTKK